MVDWSEHILAALSLLPYTRPVAVHRATVG